MSETREYHVDVHYEPDHVWAEVVDLSGCFASGKDIDELREALREAIGMYLSEQPGECQVTVFELAELPEAVSHVRARAQLVAA